MGRFCLAFAFLAVLTSPSWARPPLSSVTIAGGRPGMLEKEAVSAKPGRWVRVETPRFHGAPPQIDLYTVDAHGKRLVTWDPGYAHAELDKSGRVRFIDGSSLEIGAKRVAGRGLDQSGCERLFGKPDSSSDDPTGTLGTMFVYHYLGHFSWEPRKYYGRITSCELYVNFQGRGETDSEFRQSQKFHMTFMPLWYDAIPGEP